MPLPFSRLRCSEVAIELMVRTYVMSPTDALQRFAAWDEAHHRQHDELETW
jgi:hypothetical protein